MADAQVSDACGFLYVWVQVPSSAPSLNSLYFFTVKKTFELFFIKSLKTFFALRSRVNR